MSFLDNYVDSIDFLPIDMPKNLALMRQLDQGCAELIRSAHLQCEAFKQQQELMDQEDHETDDEDHDEKEQEETTADRKNKSVKRNKRLSKRQERLKNNINQQLQKAVDISEEKVQLSIQCYEMIDKSIRRLDEQLAKFAQQLAAEKNSGFVPPVGTNSQLFSSDAINTPFNERHLLTVNVPAHSGESRVSALKAATSLRSPALSGTTRATRLTSSLFDSDMDQSSQDSKSTGLSTSDEQLSAQVGSSTVVAGEKEEETPSSGLKRGPSSARSVRRQHATSTLVAEEADDIFVVNNVVTTQETPMLDIKVQKAPAQVQSTSSQPVQQKSKGTKRSRTVSRNSDGQSLSQRRRIDLSQEKLQTSKSLAVPPRVTKDTATQDDHALVSATHSAVMSIGASTKGQEILGAKGSVIGLRTNGAQKALKTKKKKGHVDILEADMPVDPNEPVYCYCRQVSYGPMVACDNDNCEREWFHFGCVGLTDEPKGKWYCPDCRKIMGKK